MRQGAFGVTAHSNELGDDGDGDFFGGDGADVEADGGVNSVEERGIEAFTGELAKDGDGFAFGTDHADVARRSLHGPAKDAHVVAVTTGADDDMRGLAGSKHGENLVKVPGDNLKRVWEALGICVGVAIIGDNAVEAGVAGGFEELERNVAGAKDVEERHGQNRLNEDFERTSADESGIVFGVLVEIEAEGAGFFLRDDFAGGLPDFGFDAAATDGSGDGAVVANEHLCALKRGNGAARIDDGGHGTAATLALQLHDLLVEVHEFDYWRVEKASQTAIRE